MAESQNYLNYNNPSDKSDAIKLLKGPTNQKKPFMGFVLRLEKFISNLLQLCYLLLPFLKRNTKSFGLMKTKFFFQNIREKIAKSTENTHFNPDLEKRIKWDTPRKGFGAALEHQDAGKLAFSNFFRRTLQLQRIRFL